MIQESLNQAKIKAILPQSVKTVLWKILKNIPGTRAQKRETWLNEYYTPFAVSERERLFLSMARFAHINRPLQGYYFEFGSHEANSMRLAYKHFQHFFDFTYVAFDSFEGLPEIKKIDEQEIWKKGKLKTEEDTFRDLVERSGMPSKGFYDQSLTPQLQDSLLPKKAAVIYVDCDLYLSTIPVLEFCIPFLQRGTILVFDDWNCFHGDPRKGERRAFHEFLERHPDLIFEDFVSTNEAKSFVFLGDRNSLTNADHSCAGS